MQRAFKTLQPFLLIENSLVFQFGLFWTQLILSNNVRALRVFSKFSHACLSMLVQKGYISFIGFVFSIFIQKANYFIYYFRRFC